MICKILSYQLKPIILPQINLQLLEITKIAAIESIALSWKTVNILFMNTMKPYFYFIDVIHQELCKFQIEILF